MIVPKTLRLCSTCLSRQNATFARTNVGSSSRLLNTSSKRRYHLESRIVEPSLDHPISLNRTRLGSSSSLSPPSSPMHSRAIDGHELELEVGDETEGWQARAERRSPAAVFGSKRVGLEIIPETLEERIQAEISEHHPRDIREAFLSTLPSSARGQRTKSKKRYDDSGPSLAAAKAATVLPGDYGVMANIIRELRGRLGEKWLEREEGGVVEMSSGYGPGLLALREGQESDKQMRLVHTNRHGLELSRRLFEPVTTAADQPSDIGSESVPKKVYFDRKLPSATTEKTSLAMSTFYLSTLPTISSRQVHLRQLLSLNPSYLILVDRSSTEGWQAISEARSYILSLLQETPDSWHLIAPCPHEYDCPLAGGKDRCSFSQKLQRPTFTRKTKHANRGEEDVNYTYLVIGRGPRPTNLRQGQEAEGERTMFSAVGRMGGVGREVIDKEAIKMEGKSELREVEGGEFEMVLLSKQIHEPKNVVSAESRGSGVDEETMRGEAYRWPRVVAPPMKRAGHVILDTCFPDGNIQRLTYAKSHSKQVYYDARKSAWGDLFPHEPKSKLVRKRGVRKLTKEEGFSGVGLEDGDMSVSEEMDGLLAGMENLPVGELHRTSNEAGAGDDGEVITWKSSNMRSDGSGQTRGFSTLSHRPNTSSPVPTSQRRHMSARPDTQSNGLTPALRPKVTLNTLRSLASAGTPITCLTAYDFPTALLSEAAGIDMVLVGDSLSQVALGHTSTTEVTLDEMIHHAKAVTRGAKSPFVFADMPFGSFEESTNVGVRNVIRMIKESGVDGVKIEGGREIIPLVKRLSEVGIPVIPHIGLQPQRATSLSGYLVQGKTKLAALDLFETARELHEAGATGFLLEAIPHRLAKYVTEQLGTLTIGIGAGGNTSGQVLVITDVLGLYDTADASEQGEGGNRPRFVRRFGAVGREMRNAVEGYKEAIVSGGFPEVGKETYGMKKEEWEGFLAARKAIGGEGED